MNEEKSMRKEQFLRETERQLCMAQVEAALESDNLIHASWNGKPLCTVDANGTVRFSPDNIRDVDEDRQLQTVTQTVAQVKEYLRIMARAPTLKAVGLDEQYKILAEFDDTVLAGRMSKNGVRFVTWEYDFDRRGVHAGHYFMQLYESAKQDFAVRAGLVNHQSFFQTNNLPWSETPARFRWRTMRHFRMPRKSCCAACRSRSGSFCRNRNRSSAPRWSRQCNIYFAGSRDFV